VTKFCLLVDIRDLITRVIFGDDRLRGFGVAGGRISAPQTLLLVGMGLLPFPKNHIPALGIRLFGLAPLRNPGNAPAALIVVKSYFDG